MNHTPGPWEVVFDGALAAHKEHWRVVSATSGLTLAVVEFGRAAEANARLIAAAPNLRAALEALVADERKFVTCYREAADSYIAICNFCGASHNDEYQIEHEPDCIIQQARAALAGARGGEGGG